MLWIWWFVILEGRINLISSFFFFISSCEIWLVSLVRGGHRQIRLFRKQSKDDGAIFAGVSGNQTRLSGSYSERLCSSTGLELKLCPDTNFSPWTNMSPLCLLNTAAGRIVISVTFLSAVQLCSTSLGLNQFDIQHSFDIPNKNL